jgi:hypothetical protein
MLKPAIVPAITLVRRRGDAHPGPPPRGARPLPVPWLRSGPRRDAVYGLAVLDRYGRLAERTVLRAMGWGPGQQLTLTLLAASVLATPCPGSTVRVGNDGYLRLPIGVRRACRLVAGDRMLLVAEPPAGRLLLHPPAALDALPTTLMANPDPEPEASNPPG